MELRDEFESPDASAVNRVAAAIYGKIAWAYKWDGNTPYSELNKHAKAVLMDIARTAIAAMRGP